MIRSMSMAPLIVAYRLAINQIVRLVSINKRAFYVLHFAPIRQGWLEVDAVF